MSRRPSNAIAGNESFTQIETDTEINFVNVNNIAVNKVAFGNFSDSGAYPGKVLQRMTGYAPKEFIGKKHDKGFFFNKKPGQADATSKDAEQLFTLPVGAIILSARLTNNGTTVTAGGEGAPPTTARLGVNIQAWTDTGPSSARLMSQAPLITGTGDDKANSTVNNLSGLATFAQVASDPTQCYFGKSGQTNQDEVGTDQSLIVLKGQQNVGGSVAIQPAANGDLAITAGDLAILIEYAI